MVTVSKLKSGNVRLKGNKEMLKGVITAIVTPMKTGGEIDFVSLENLVKFQVDNQVCGIIVAGSTGEGDTLSDAERLLVIQRVIEVAQGRVKIIVGSGSLNTRLTGEFLERVNKIAEVDYILAGTPAYFRPTQEGLYQHYAYLSGISAHPIILYNVPGRTGCNLEDDTILKLSHDFSNIVGLKDAAGNISRCCYMVKHRRKGFALLSGDDEMALPFILCGGDGLMSVSSNLFPHQMKLLCDYALNGNNAEAIELNKQMLELYRFMSMSNPIPIKWALFYAGLISTPELRLPLTVFSEQLQGLCKPVLSKLLLEK